MARGLCGGDDVFPARSWVCDEWLVECSVQNVLLAEHVSVVRLGIIMLKNVGDELCASRCRLLLFCSSLSYDACTVL